MTDSNTPDTHAETEQSPQEARAQESVKTYMLTSLGAGLIPLPLVDVALVSGIQLKMLHSLAEIYEQEFNKEIAHSIIGALIGGVVPATATSSFAKLIPGAGTISGMISMSALSSASTYAVGQVFIKHFESGGTLLTFDVEAMRDYFIQTFEDGKKVAANLGKGKTAETDKEAEAGK